MNGHGTSVFLRRHTRLPGSNNRDLMTALRKLLGQELRLPMRAPQKGRKMIGDE
jgi:hypothetical protein